MRSTTVRFENGRDMEIAGVIDHPADAAHDDPSQQFPGAVLCHSFTGYKEIPHLEAAADALTDRGIVTLRFDFTDCVGASEGACEDMTLSNQVQDLRDALDWFESRGDVDPNRIGVGGHSLGGMTSILVAADDDRVGALVPVAAPRSSETEQLFQGREIDRWRRMGHIHFPTVKRGEVTIGWQFYEDLQQYDALDVVGDVTAPVRFVHGDADEIVPVSDSEALYEAANTPKDLQIVEGADHLFRQQAHQDAMVGAVADWMKRQL